MSRRELAYYVSLWQIRKSKFYNPNRVCGLCKYTPVSPHISYCSACVDRIRHEAEDQADYFETIQSVLTSSHPW